MGKINDWVGTIGGVILVLELIVLLLLLVAINAGLIFGLRWVRGKNAFVHQKRQQGQSLLTKYVNRGADLAAAPVIISTSAWRGLKAGLYRATHWSAHPALTTGAGIHAALPPKAADVPELPARQN